MKTTVVHFRTKHDIYVGRPSPYGNPFSHRPGTMAMYRVESREEAISAYEAWVQMQPDLMSNLINLKGKILGCWCKPKACHADVLARLADLLPEAAHDAHPF